ncbi:hypothetical protein A0J61_01208 [Choanephora cucurbitarum]|uniref:Uncharacterized protein n=1 Tax=Choanephora cucurbitarum TaxID=101091 RepID=A0A1C7NP50_9FUNG|nr:hypothetical protein A0J61_01208 [Choanephora cucurbitarum]
MGNGISKVNCGDIALNKKHHRNHRRPTIRIDKSLIAYISCWQHKSYARRSKFLDAPKDLLATMAQITDALKKFPIHTTKKSPNKFIRSPLVDRVNGSHSDQQISRHHSLQQSPIKTSSMMIDLPQKHAYKTLSPFKTEDEENISTMDLTGGYYDFSSCLQSRVDAQIIEIARARSKNKSIRSPRSNHHLLNDMPTIMI